VAALGGIASDPTKPIEARLHAIDTLARMAAAEPDLGATIASALKALLNLSVDPKVDRVNFRTHVVKGLGSLGADGAIALVDLNSILGRDDQLVDSAILEAIDEIMKASVAAKTTSSAGASANSTTTTTVKIDTSTPLKIDTSTPLKLDTSSLFNVDPNFWYWVLGAIVLVLVVLIACVCVSMCCRRAPCHEVKADAPASPDTHSGGEPKPKPASTKPDTKTGG
jgi:hypothetical protein